MSTKQVAYAVAVTPDYHNTFKHIYNIYIRKPLCFADYFSLTKKNDKWSLQFFNSAKKYLIPNKDSEDLCKILLKLGIKKKGNYMLHLINEDDLLIKKKFYNIKDTLDFIYDTEMKLEGVTYL